MKLRHWQAECVAKAQQQYQHHSHFLCLATPGAGKTIMAAEVSESLLASSRIDFVLCFSPSVAVAEGMQKTFTQRLNRRFDGVIGAVGCSYTYQTMLYFKHDFWQLFENNRVLVVFDEIHHCSGTNLENANAWGEQIILNIQNKAAYTLALTGTPWRSDKAPIVLSRYSNPDNSIHCDYSYGLNDAVNDGVCRKPKIVLIDNEKITVTDQEQTTKTFSGFRELLSRALVSYQSIIINEEAIRYILAAACNKLAEIRQTNPSAAGLVVASSIEHAATIAHMLKAEFGCSVLTVNYRQPDAPEIINRFRHSSAEWIVSIGMISEGTDIPRLQVCCHLSHIKTELHFRQVLGRILRTTHAPNQHAWLYTFAEPTLVDYAYRISDDLPQNDVIIRDLSEKDDEQILKNHREAISSNIPIDLCFADTAKEYAEDLPPTVNAVQPLTTDKFEYQTFQLIGRFREQVIATFDSPF